MLIKIKTIFLCVIILVIIGRISGYKTPESNWLRRNRERIQRENEEHIKSETENNLIHSKNLREQIENKTKRKERLQNEREQAEFGIERGDRMKLANRKRNTKQIENERRNRQNRRNRKRHRDEFTSGIFLDTKNFRDSSKFRRNKAHINEQNTRDIPISNNYKSKFISREYFESNKAPKNPNNFQTASYYDRGRPVEKKYEHNLSPYNFENNEFSHELKNISKILTRSQEVKNRNSSIEHKNKRSNDKFDGTENINFKFTESNDTESCTKVPKEFASGFRGFFKKVKDRIGNMFSKNNKSSCLPTKSSVFNHMNVSTQKSINKIKDMMEFIKQLQKTKKVHKQKKHKIYFSSEAIALRPAIQDGFQNFVGCRPLPTSVPIKSHTDGLWEIYPPCILLDRCQGCCVGYDLSCQPTKTETVEFSMLNLTTNAKDGSLNKSDAIVRLERHLECDCECVVKKEDCNERQFYNEDFCECQCVDKKAEENCSTKTSTHYWNWFECKCLCIDARKCSTGEYFDHDTCRCNQIK